MILREISFGVSRSSKNAIFEFLEPQNFVLENFFAILEGWIHQIQNFATQKLQMIALFELLDLEINFTLTKWQKNPKITTLCTLLCPVKCEFP